MWRALLLVFASSCTCGQHEAPHEPPPPQVATVAIEPTSVKLRTELPARVSAVRAAEVRARVDGIVQQQLYAEGAHVQQGQPLFQIDPAPYRAALERARAQLASAEAAAVSAKLLAQRNARLIEKNAVSRQEYDNAIAQEKTAEANIASARAQVTTAEIELGYTRVFAPISGKSGRSAVTVGAFVRSGEATLLTTVTQLDPIYVDASWSSAAQLRVRRALDRGDIVEGKPTVSIVLEDGKEYPELGTVLVTGVNVEETTGSVPLRAKVPNPKGELLPGMYVQVRLHEGTDPHALLVPQRAVTRDRSGNATALVVGPNGVVEQRKLTTDRAVDNAWLVTDGIAAGEHVIVEGQQRVKPGTTVEEVAAPAQQARRDR